MGPADRPVKENVLAYLAGHGIDLAGGLGAEDTTCDACRDFIEDGIHPVVVQAGPVIYLFGFCTICRVNGEPSV